MTMPTVVSLRYGCHLCEQKLSEASKLKQHLLNRHGLDLPSRSEGRTRVNTQQFTYISQAHEGNYMLVHMHYACVSCLSHFSDLKQLKFHIDGTHNEESSADSATPTPTQSGSNEDDEGVSQLTYFSPEPSSDDNHYTVDDFDVSRAFHQFQNSINAATSNLFMESHGMSYVLLIKPHRMHPNLVNIFGAENVDRLQNHVRHEFGFEPYGRKFNVELMLELKSIVREVQFQQMTRLAAQADLLQKASVASPLISRIICSVARLITMLPNEEITSIIKEQELCTRYLDPAPVPLFDDPENNIFFRLLAP
ncbi:uncharacterized protein BYT42DRAFT_549817 [Radiomyces spectabilis]|uniref:uncharacterized protein n=1 Tax=Radiomyces spectabilis TaxID=64574 RepID=UPI00221FA2EF|nr:uncharacterized protein BYT42DRAFT_549817 [Radiomyces spectabilis]KAI8366748.1 hypothetical protein BYT42DRAFT_549817 [Radiomyces spectabilis]